MPKSVKITESNEFNSNKTTRTANWYLRTNTCTFLRPGRRPKRTWENSRRTSTWLDRRDNHCTMFVQRLAASSRKYWVELAKAPMQLDTNCKSCCQQRRRQVQLKFDTWRRHCKTEPSREWERKWSKPRNFLKRRESQKRNRLAQPITTTLG